MNAISKLLVGMGVGGVIAFIGLLIMIAIGWVMNIIDLVHMLNGPITAIFVARIVGIFFAPLGAVLGWFF